MSMRAPRLLQIMTLQGHSFIPGYLSSKSTVVDLGANLGEFSGAIRARFGCRCIAVEPNRALIDKIRCIEVVWAAIAGNNEEVELDVAGGVEESRIVPSGTAPLAIGCAFPGRRLELLLRGRLSGREKNDVRMPD
jgi:hypothetical protein